MSQALHSAHPPSATPEPHLPRVVFMGSPDFAVPSLAALAGAYPVVGVFTQPDRPAGRGRQLQAPPVKERALGLGLPVFQPASLRKDPTALAQLRDLAPDLVVVAAYGLLLPPAVLALPRWGCVNVHASLLPRWRGAAPVAHAILEGDPETGICLMLMDEGLDTGAVIARQGLAIAPESTSGTLTAELAELGAGLLVERLPDWIAGRIAPAPQDEALATYAPRLSKEDGRLHFGGDAIALARRVRAMHPWPGCFCTWSRGRLKVLRARVGPDAPGGMGPGTCFAAGDLPAVACRTGSLVLEQLQAEGGRPTDGAAFLRGFPDLLGQALGGDA